MSDRGAESPSPFSREGSRPSDALGADQEPTGSVRSERRANRPGRPTPGRALPRTRTPPPADPYAAPYVAPGFDPQPTPAYASYGDGRPYDLTPPAAYGTNPYEVTPYQPDYGGYSPYGTVGIQHPRAATAMVLGIISIVLAASCGIGGFLGIGGIVQGRKARNEIDAEPGRYAGRSQASPASSPEPSAWSWER